MAAAVVALLCGVVGCKPQAKQSAEKSIAPATIAQIADEQKLNTIVLTEAAERRLGLTTARAERKPISRHRTFGGELTLPVGASIIVSAPVAGTLLAPAGASETPVVGAKVVHRQPVFKLLPLLATERSVLSPGERIRFAEAKNAISTARVDAQGQVRQAEVQVEAARIALERAQRLLREQAGTARAVDDAQAQLSLAQKGLDAAMSRKKLVDEIDLEDDPAKLRPLAIESPRDGLLRSLQAAAGEVVASGAPLFEVIDVTKLWVRVPIYIGETTDLDAAAPVKVTLEQQLEAAPVMAQPIAAPPTATATASSVDWYYAVDNPTGQLRPAQRVDVAIKLRQPADALVVPWSAVIHDIQGGTWVYQQTEPRTYVRRRVLLRYVEGGQAVLERGLTVDASVVTTGAMELFGAEFGIDLKKK
jgi:RND family efflux transporter MFP subunit